MTPPPMNKLQGGFLGYLFSITQNIQHLIYLHLCCIFLYHKNLELIYYIA